MARRAPFVHRNLPLLLLQAREAVMQHRRPTLRAHGLSDPQWRVLRVLREHDGAGGIETGRLAAEAFILGPSLTGVLARMEQGGLLTRHRSPEDARRSMVRASASGLVLADALSHAIESQYDELEARLGKLRLEQLYDLLDELIAVHPHETSAAEAELEA